MSAYLRWSDVTEYNAERVYVVQPLDRVNAELPNGALREVVVLGDDRLQAPSWIIAWELLTLCTINRAPTYSASCLPDNDYQTFHSLAGPNFLSILSLNTEGILMIDTLKQSFKFPVIFYNLRFYLSIFFPS